VDLIETPRAYAELCDTVAHADAVAPVGARTHWEVGGPPPVDAVPVAAPGGIITFDPADLTVTVAAGTSCGELAATLADAGQEVALDPRDPAATVGGVLAVGLSGHRRLRWGPVRDRVLEVRFVTADGRVVKGGGPTVKNVSGYDVPRLLVGSFGTIGLLAQVTLRCQPLPTRSQWCTTPHDPFEARRRAYRPACILYDGRTTTVLLEGAAADVEVELARLDGNPATPPDWPDGPHRARISVSPAELRTLFPRLGASGVRWCAEIGVGTVHVAADTVDGFVAARDAATAVGGWMLREAGAPGVDGFGRALPNAPLMARLRAAFDPTTKLSPGRLPVPVPGG
jgi:glycolate oxidase FAD binding subunit